MKRNLFSCLTTMVFVTFFIGIISPGKAQVWEMRVCAESNNLPFSNDRGEGFENRIAEIIASDLNAELAYVWLNQPSATLRDRYMEQGDCDLVMATTDGHSGFSTTLAYYRSSYVFVYLQDSPFEVRSFDDPILRDLRIGVQMPGGQNVAPPSKALANRDLIPNQVGFVMDYNQPDSLAAVIEAVVQNKVDVAIAWGPVGGYFAKQQPVALEVVPVSPEIEPPFLPMVFSISIGVRMGDEDLRDQINIALTRRWDDIQEVLEEYGVPTMPLPKPQLSAGGQ